MLVLVEVVNGSQPANESKDRSFLGVGKLLFTVCVHVTTPLNMIQHHKHDNALPKMGWIEKTGKDLSYPVELVAILKTINNLMAYVARCPFIKSSCFQTNDAKLRNYIWFSCLNDITKS